MLDIGWQEILVIGVVALLVVGPKELPRLLRTVGQWAGRARSMAREFQRSMDEAAREADVAEFKELTNLKQDVEKMGGVDFKDQARRTQESLANLGKPAGTGDRADGAAAPEADTETAAETAAKTAAGTGTETDAATGVAAGVGKPAATTGAGQAGTASGRSAAASEEDPAPAESGPSKA